MEKERGITIINTDKTKQCDIHVVMCSLLVEMQETIDYLKDIVNKGDIYSDSEALYCYSYDASYRQAQPEIIVRPHSSAEVSKIVKVASNEKIPIVPRGAGTREAPCFQGRKSLLCNMGQR